MEQWLGCLGLAALNSHFFGVFWHLSRKICLSSSLF
jgi:hypothetical protein